VPALVSKGAKLRVYDPFSMEKAKPLFRGVKYCKDPYEAAQGAEAILILTEWNEFKHIDFQKLKKIVKQPVIIDGRNMYETQEMAEKGFSYHGMGRGEVSQF
jgi:UDPglucose 6-dehydrogenase